MTITVYGTPAPQGSKKFLGIKGGRGILVESSKAVKPWREAVKWAVRDQVHVTTALTGRVAGPVHVDMIFTMPKPKSAKRGAVPSNRPDLSKLVRATEDALTDAGVWEDDARVVRCVSSKVFPNEGIDALNIPGAVIHIRSANA